MSGGYHGWTQPITFAYPQRKTRTVAANAMDSTEVKQEVERVARGVKRVAAQALGVDNEAKAVSRNSSFAIGFMGSRSIFRNPFHARAVVEQKFGNLPCGAFANKISLLNWAAATPFEEFHLGALLVSDGGGTGGRTTSPQTPVQGTARSNRIGDSIYIDYLDLRLCIEGEAYEGSSIKSQCCRLVVLQLMDATDFAFPRSFLVSNFFESGNITSGYTRNIERQERYATGGDAKHVTTYKILLDKTFTVGAGEKFEERRMHLRFKLGNQMFDSNDSNELNFKPGRIIYQLFTEEPTAGLRPCFYGDWRWQYRDP